MPITIRGIRIKSLNITPAPSSGDEKLTGTYQLISSTDKVLAEQSIGGYNSLKFPPSPPTQKALDAFLELYRADIQTAIGIEAV